MIEFVMYLESLPSLREAGLQIARWFGPFDDAAPAIPDPEDPFPAEPQNLPLAFELQGIQYSHPYLTERGFEVEECMYMGVGFFPGKGSMRNRVVFPIHDEMGKLVAYAGRSIDPNCEHSERWRFPAGFFKTLTIYGLHVVEGDEAIVVESFWGVMACVRAGVMNAVSIMGTFISDMQAELLAHHFRRVVVMLDGDEFGRAATGKVVDQLVAAEVEDIDVVMLPKGIQPDDLSPDELRRFLKLPNVIYRWSAIDTESVPS